MRSFHNDAHLRKGVLCFKSSNIPGIFKEQFKLRAANHFIPRENQTCGGNHLDQSLQPIPIRLRNFAQFFRRVEDQIDNHQREIAVSQKKIGRFDSFRCFAAPDPKQVLQSRILNSGRVKRIASINQGQEIIIAIRAMDQRVNERCAARAYLWADQFRDRPTRQSAANLFVKKR